MNKFINSRKNINKNNISDYYLGYIQIIFLLFMYL